MVGKKEPESELSRALKLRDYWLQELDKLKEDYLSNGRKKDAAYTNAESIIDVRLGEVQKHIGVLAPPYPYYTPRHAVAIPSGGQE